MDTPPVLDDVRRRTGLEAGFGMRARLYDPEHAADLWLSAAVRDLGREADVGVLDAVVMRHADADLRGRALRRTD
jgi:hypothetical protein